MSVDQHGHERVAVVTGGASGIGAAIARALSSQDVHVVVADVNRDGASRTAAELVNASAVALDVTDEEKWQEIVETVCTRFGAVDVLVNNAGIPCHGNVEELSLHGWNQCLAVDLTGAFLGCRTVLPALADGGNIVNVSSAYGLVVDADTTAYNVAKAGVVTLTRSVALHSARAGRGLRCNCVCPGVTSTSMLEATLASKPDPTGALQALKGLHPLARLAAPEEIAHAVSFLASDGAGFITGAVLAVDGGLSI